jgi:hypothetical protein
MKVVHRINGTTAKKHFHIRILLRLFGHLIITTVQ